MEPANNMSGPDTGSGPDRLQQIRERFDRADEHADKLRGNSLNSEALISDHHSDSRGDSGLDVYQDITSSLRDQSLQRHENRISKIEQLQDSIKFRLIGRVAVVAALLLLTAIIYHAVTTRQATEVPQSLAIWMEQQKLLRQVAQVQQWLASGQAQSDLPPPESGWRRSEAITKSLVEISVARCFMDADDTDNAAVHYTRAYCASVSNPDPHEAMTALYGLARISWLADDTQQVSHYTQCSEDLLDYHLRQEPDVNTLSNFITLALLLYELTGDSGESIRVKEKGLAAARELMPDVEEHELEVVREVMLILQMNLMEVYLTLNETEPLNQLYDELKGNPMLEEGDRLVALGLLAMQDLIDNNHASAREHLRRITTRYQALAEFTTMWSWEAIDRWHEETESTRSAIVNEQIKDIRLALSNERPADSMQRLYRVLAATGGR